MLNRIRNQKGFTLLEMLVAGAILTVGLLGIASMMISSMQGNNYARRVSIATNLAQQRIEEMKNIPFKNLFCGPGSDCPYMPTPTTTPGPVANITPVDNGSNPSPCTAVYPCGDVTTNNSVWTYSLSYTDPDTGIVFRRIWTVQRNPDINGNGTIDADEQGTIRVEAIVSWNNSKDVAPVKWHKIAFASIIAG